MRQPNEDRATPAARGLPEGNNGKRAKATRVSEPKTRQPAKICSRRAKLTECMIR